MTKEELVERIIGKYWTDNGASLDKDVMLYDMTRCNLLSAAILRSYIMFEMEGTYDE